MDFFDLRLMKRWQWWLVIVFYVTPGVLVLISINLASFLFDSLSDFFNFASRKSKRMADYICTGTSKLEWWLESFAKGE
ncbi:MAG: hypothetical protein ACRDCY_07915 [Aeromonas veronii]